MTQVARKIAKAFKAGRSHHKINNTITCGNVVWLHGWKIAWRDHKTKMIFVTLAGYPTVTTRDRVNAILWEFGADFRIRQQRGEQFLYYWNTDELKPIASHDYIPVAGPLVSLIYELERKGIMPLPELVDG